MSLEQPDPDPQQLAEELHRTYTEEYGFTDEELIDIAPDLVPGQSAETEPERTLSLVRTKPSPTREIAKYYQQAAGRHLQEAKAAVPHNEAPEVLARRKRDEELEAHARAVRASQQIVDDPDNRTAKIAR